MIWSVLGTGVTGLCVATTLVENGAAVEIVESPGMVPASHWAGGMLAPFCEGESAPASVTSRGQLAVDWWCARVSDVTRRGTLVVAPARDAAELKRFAQLTQGHEWVNPGSVEPDLGSRFAQGLLYPTEAHLNPRNALSELRQKLIGNGVEIHDRSPSGRIIDCRGISAITQLSDLRAVRGEMLIVEAHDVNITRTIRLLHPRFPCYIVPRGAGQYMIGATMVESNDSGPITGRAIMELLSAAYTVQPAFAEARLIETGTGLRPAFPDNLPSIRYHAGTIFVNGMYRHGFLLAPILAEQLVKQLSSELTCAD